ncbi:hypothetical protein RKD18_002852 [Streptomyces phaeoluteigriseus]
MPPPRPRPLSSRHRPPVPPERPDTAADERVLEAAENCPVEAIVITLADNGEAVFPPEE